MFLHTRDQCDHCCLWCEFFERCKWDYIYDQMRRAVQYEDGE